MTSADDYELHLLPESMQWMEREIGLPAVRAIIKRHGGIAPLYIPKHFDPDHYLVRLIGAEATVKLIAKYKGDTIDIPVCERAMLEATYQQIKRESLDSSSEQLAIKYGYTLRHIRNITKGVVDDRQGEMF